MERGNSEPVRVVLLGGAYGTLALARSLKRAGAEVWLVAEETRCASFSNAVRKVVPWVGPNHPRAIDAFEDVARANSLIGSILVPGADPEVRFVAEAHGRLSSLFRVLTSPWEDLRWACDKSLAYRRAGELGLGFPRVYEPAQFEQRVPAGLRFPLVLKPSMRVETNRFTSDRGWRVDDWSQFRERYQSACELVGAEHVIAQQLIPGGGEHQLSYAGLWNEGAPVIGLTARRLRQHPVEFGNTSTYVVSAQLPEVTAAAETFLRSIRHHGLVEIEFKRDPGDGVLKLLDVNPRPWNWMALAAAAGVDFGRAIVAVASGEQVASSDARPGVGWIFAARDLVAAAQSGRLRPRALPGYAATWPRVRSCACFSWTDPLPGIVDLPATFGRMLLRRVKRADALRSQPGTLHS
jgi:D-aspartate ligase